MAKKSIIIKTLLVFIIILVSCFSVISCDILEKAADFIGWQKPDEQEPGEQEPGEENPGEVKPEWKEPGFDDTKDNPVEPNGIIYDSETYLKVLITDYKSVGMRDAVDDFITAIKENLGDRAYIDYTDGEKASHHEIVIGPSEREVSKAAYLELETLMADYGDTYEFGGYVLYSDGVSLALAYTEEIECLHLKEIGEYLAESAKEDSYSAEAGVVSSKVYNMYEEYAAVDKIRQDEAFVKLAAATSQEVADAVRDLYTSLYTRYYGDYYYEPDGKTYTATIDIVSWLAKLYEPRQCICDNYVNGVNICLHPVDENGKELCRSGGFHYCNAARDNGAFNADGQKTYQVDIESTYQALCFLEKTGMLQSFSNNFGSFVTGQFRADIVAFTKGLQDSNGYFYHPQWTREQYENNPSRLSRDLMWSVAILKEFGARPYYRTADGQLSGTGGRPSSAAALTSRLNESTISSVSRVIMTSSSLPERYQSVENLKAYLATRHLDQYGEGYTVANLLAADINLIISANARIGGNLLKDALFEWIEDTHREDNGLWTPTCYDALNCAFKLMMVYSAFGMKFPYAEKALNSAIDVLNSDEDPGHVCGAYNTWYDIAGLIGNIRRYESSEKADELHAKVIEIAPGAIRNTGAITKIFMNITKIFTKIDGKMGWLVQDGSFHYRTYHLSETSQGMPVAPGQIKQGDVNASLICTGGLVEHIGQALRVNTMPPIYGTQELAVFMDIINSKY